MGELREERIIKKFNEAYPKSKKINLDLSRQEVCIVAEWYENMVQQIKRGDSAKGNLVNIHRRAQELRGLLFDEER